MFSLRSKWIRVFSLHCNSYQYKVRNIIENLTNVVCQQCSDKNTYQTVKTILELIQAIQSDNKFSFLATLIDN